MIYEMFRFMFLTGTKSVQLLDFHVVLLIDLVVCYVVLLC